MIPQIFNLNKRSIFKQRVQKKFKEHDFLHKEIFLNHLERLSMILQDMPSITLIDVPEHFTDLPEAKAFFEVKKTTHIEHVSRNDEYFPQHIQNQDAIIALLTCHSVNDLVGYFIQIKNALVSDGVFIGSFIGDKIISLLKNAFANAELDINGSYSKRFHPTIDIKDLGGLLQRAGFALPVTDSEDFFVRYKNLETMISDLRGTGEANCLNTDIQPLTKKIYYNALENIAKQVPDHRFAIDIITATGRSPSDAQQKPLKPGSAQVSLSKVL